MSNQQPSSKEEARKHQPVCRLYLISPPAIDPATFPALLEQAFSGGDIASFQLRLKHAGDEEIISASRALVPICHAHDCAFILNDRPDLLVQCGADGVHLGQEDLERWPLAKVRATIGEEAIIGVSAHASTHLAMEAGEQGADYVAFGAFYPTQSKPMEKIERWGMPTPDILDWWQTYTILPCVAIGGITPENCAPLVRAGADFIAAISAVWNDPISPAHAVGAMNLVIKKAKIR